MDDLREDEKSSVDCGAADTDSKGRVFAACRTEDVAGIQFADDGVDEWFHQEGEYIAMEDTELSTVKLEAKEETYEVSTLTYKQSRMLNWIHEQEEFARQNGEDLDEWREAKEMLLATNSESDTEYGSSSELKALSEWDDSDYEEVLEEIDSDENVEENKTLELVMLPVEYYLGSDDIGVTRQGMDPNYAARRRNELERVFNENEEGELKGGKRTVRTEVLPGFFQDWIPLGQHVLEEGAESREAQKDQTGAGIPIARRNKRRESKPRKLTEKRAKSMCPLFKEEGCLNETNLDQFAVRKSHTFPLVDCTVRGVKDVDVVWSLMALHAGVVPCNARRMRDSLTVYAMKNKKSVEVACGEFLQRERITIDEYIRFMYTDGGVDEMSLYLFARKWNLPGFFLGSSKRWSECTHFNQDWNSKGAFFVVFLSDPDGTREAVWMSRHHRLERLFPSGLDGWPAGVRKTCGSTLVIPIEKVPELMPNRVKHNKLKTAWYRLVAKSYMGTLDTSSTEEELKHRNSMLNVSRSTGEAVMMGAKDALEGKQKSVMKEDDDRDQSWLHVVKAVVDRGAEIEAEVEVETESKSFECEEEEIVVTEAGEKAETHQSKERDLAAEGILDSNRNRELVEMMVVMEVDPEREEKSLLEVATEPGRKPKAIEEDDSLLEVNISRELEKLRPELETVTLEEDRADVIKQRSELEEYLHSMGITDNIVDVFGDVYSSWRALRVRVQLEALKSPEDLEESSKSRQKKTTKKKMTLPDPERAAAVDQKRMVLPDREMDVAVDQKKKGNETTRTRNLKRADPVDEKKKERKSRDDSQKKKITAKEGVEKEKVQSQEEAGFGGARPKQKENVQRKGKLEKGDVKVDPEMNIVRGDKALITKFQCETGRCASNFPDKKSKKRHMEWFHSAGLLKCGVCGQQFEELQELKEHEKDHMCPYECDECGRAFHYEARLVQHVEVVHDKSRLFECETCDRVFHSAAECKQHTAGCVSPLVCEYCGWKSRHLKSFRDHIQGYHEGGFRCENCERVFESRSMRNRHRKKEHK